MSPEMILAIAGGVIGVIGLLIIVVRKAPKRVKSTHYTKKWREIQRMCADKQDWNHAIIHADMLLDEVLEKKKTAGNTMGERMVAAQDKFTANDKLWVAHKLAVSLRDNGDKQVTQTVVKNALVTFRQALRDLGAL